MLTFVLLIAIMFIDCTGRNFDVKAKYEEFVGITIFLDLVFGLPILFVIFG